MNTYVLGIRDPDDKWTSMKAIYDAYIDAGVEPPDVVLDFFNGEPPDSNGITITLEEIDGVVEYKDDMREGYEVDLASLPDNITRLRFVNSY